MAIVEVDVDPADPHNDQAAARARDDLDWHVRSARTTLGEAAGGVVEATAVIAVALAQSRDTYPRDRLTAMLAAALVKLAGAS